jgi:hypothetical protein
MTEKQLTSVHNTSPASIVSKTSSTLPHAHCRTARNFAFFIFTACFRQTRIGTQVIDALLIARAVQVKRALFPTIWAYEAIQARAQNTAIDEALCVWTT